MKKAKQFLEGLAQDDNKTTDKFSNENPLLTAGVIGDPLYKLKPSQPSGGDRYSKDSVFPEFRAYDATVLAFNEEQLLSPSPAGYRVSRWGTGQLLLYLVILDDLQEGRLRPDQEVVFSERAASVGKDLRGTSGKAGEKRYLQDLLNQAISLNAPDCILALCGVYGGVEGAMKKINQLGRRLQVSESSHKNASGRLAKKQMTNIYDYYKIGLGFLRLARSSFAYLTNRPHIIRGKTYLPQSITDLKGTTIASIYWGTDKSECLLFREVDGKLCCSVVINSRHYIHATEMGLLAMEPQALVPPTVVELTSPIVNFLGDTYLGEFYTERRKKQKREDALQKYGYHHTLAKLTEKIHEKDYSVVTFEGVLIQPEEESLNKRKIYYLGGEKRPNLKELKDRHFNLVNFANNHAKDYGTRALLDSIDSLRGEGIETIGAGANLNEAVRPVLLRYQGKEAALFSGYWYRQSKDLDFDFYGINRDGVASLQGALLDRIKNFKEAHPKTIVIVIPHWGNDFKDVSREQHQVAKMLVDAGADLIIGSGPHKIQPLTRINGVPTFYSIGNGAFNSDGGGLKEKGSLPYGLFLKWHLLEESVQIYPFNSYNPETFWQPDYFTADKAQKVHQDLKQLNQNQYFEEITFDQQGHLYYEMSTRSQRQSTPVIGWSQWFQKNLKGHFLNPEISQQIQLDFATFNVKRLENFPQYQKVLYVSLSAENHRDLASKAKWQPLDGNTSLLQSDEVHRVALILTDKPIKELADKIPQYIVEDALLASMLFAGYVAENYQGDWVAITGSAGKTSTRNMLRSLLKDQAPITNIENTNLKVPSYDLSLNLLADAPAAIFEAAASGFNRSKYGSMGYLWQNDVVVFTSFGTAHAIAGVQRNLQVKSGIFMGLKNGGTAVINGDIEERYLWKILAEAQRQQATIRLTSLERKAAYCHLVSKEVGRSATKVQVKLGDRYVDFSLRVDSDGQIRNAMAALVTLEALGYDVYERVDRLADFENFDRIFQQVEITNEKGHYTVIDDTFNSSILALENGIRTFIEKQRFFHGNKVMVIGETADMGEFSESEHLKLLPLFQQCQDAKILLQGPGLKKVAAALENADYYESKDEMLAGFQQYVNEDALIFVKGSSLGKFKTVADQIKAGDFN